MVLVALLLIRFVQHAALPDTLLAGLPWPQQALIGAVLGLLVGGASSISALRKPGAGTVQRTADSYGQLDLRGLNPIWISLAAGVGEELLFRAALQPLIGIWLSSCCSSCCTPGSTISAASTGPLCCKQPACWA